MNAESNPDVKKRSPISPLFLIGALGVLLVGYFAGPSIMTYVMYLQEERAKASTPLIAKDEIAPRPEGLSFGGTMPSSPSPGGENPPPADLKPRFADLDEDGDGNLTGDELTERITQRLEQFDTDGDGSISKAEFMARLESRPEANTDEASEPSDSQQP